MPIEFAISSDNIAYGVATGVAGIIAWYARRHVSRVDTDISAKADKAYMDREIQVLGREIERLNSQLEAVNDAHQQDKVRIERVNAEKHAEFASAMRDRFSTLEANLNERITSMREDVGHKLDLILKIVEKN